MSPRQTQKRRPATVFSRHLTSARSRRSLLVPELLEDRTLLSTLDITTSGSGSSLVESLSYIGSAGKTNHLTISTTGIGGKYTFMDTGETITLGAGALAAGWTGTGTNTVTGPDSSVTEMTVNTGDMNDTVVVQSTDAPVTLYFNNAASNIDSVTLGSDAKKGAQLLNANVTIVNLKGTTDLTVDDSADNKGRTINVSSTTITGLLPSNTNLPLASGTIDYTDGKLARLVIDESNGVVKGNSGTTLVVTSSPASANLLINTGMGSVNSTTVQTSGGAVGIKAQGTDSITLGSSSKGVQLIGGNVMLTNSSGASVTSLVVDDSGDVSARSNVQITSGKITGLAPEPIDYSALTNLVALSIKGGQGGNSFTVASLPNAIVTLNTGASATINPNKPNLNIVTVNSTTDPANMNTLILNGQGEDSINLGPSVSVNVIGSTNLLTVPTPMVIDAAGPNDNVTLTNSSASTGSINGAVLVAGNLGSTALVVDDSADTTARVGLVTVSSTNPTLTEVDGILPATISFNPDDLSSLNLIGAGRLDTLNVNANKHGPATVSPGPSIGTGTISIDSNLPIQYANMSAVNITNAADLPLAPVNQAVVTTTGDLSTEGRALPFLAAQFTDADVNARSSNFTAVINWGDGTTSPGSIASQGSLNGSPLFTVTGTHTYDEAGNYPVVVSITDLGTGAAPSVIGGIPVTITDLGGSAAVTGSTIQTNLLSNGAIPSLHTDSQVVDPWGMATSTAGPFWLANAGSGVATVNDGSGTPVSPGPVTIPGPGGGSSSPTGIVFNGGSGFVISGGPARFLFDTQSGTIDGWNSSLGGTAQIVLDNSGSGASYSGLALAANQLYAVDFAKQSIEVFDASFHAVTLSPGAFTDPEIPGDYAPYGIQNINGALYVTYAKMNATRTDVVPGTGNGYVDVYDTSGNLLDRFASNAPLNAPWGVALAPASFGQYGGDLLVANHGDGTIAAFDPASGAFLGMLVNDSNQILTIDGLRGLAFGNGGSGNSTGTLYFTSGPAGGAQGLFGSIDANPTIRPGAGPNIATIIDTPITGSIVNISTVEGEVYSNTVATFSDSNPLATAADFTAVIDWGDGAATPGKIMVSSSNPGSTFYVVPDPASNTHTYDETGVPPHVLPYVLSVTITDKDGATVTVQGSASVADANLVLSAGVPDFSVPEGNPLSTSGPIPVATFVDTNPNASVNDFTANGQFGAALINWGDGNSSTGVVQFLTDTLYGPEFAVLGNHTYLKVGPSLISVSIVDFGGKTASASTNVLVNEASLIDPTGFSIPGTEGVELVGVNVGSFVDTNPQASETDFKATIDWGDGSSGSGVVQFLTNTANGPEFEVIGSHKYTEAMPTGTAPGTPFPITVTVDDSAGDLGGARIPIQSTATISDGALTLISASTVSAVENTSASGVSLITFSDTDPIATASDFNVSITWTAGGVPDTTSGVVSLIGLAPNGNPLFKVTGTHTYPTSAVGTAQ
ncbi:MAG: TIGR03118 family protein, partial [Isosphaeraceae bacterium]